MSGTKEKIFEIDEGSIVKASKQGYFYCTTTPPHPFGEKRKDRKKKYVYLHRAVMEQDLGRYLEPHEQVDHKDKDKSNNDISNLRLVNFKDHQRSHATDGKNQFWKHSPRTKPRKKNASDSVYRVVLAFLTKRS
jgi:hypothetical protein